MRFHLDGDELMIYQIPPDIQAEFDAKGAVVGATWSLWDAGNDPMCYAGTLGLSLSKPSG